MKKIMTIKFDDKTKKEFVEIRPATELEISLYESRRKQKPIPKKDKR